ncbi:MAG: NUDIX hydrolase [Blautia sp.]|jgi:ADP-ribose pyrophosphatase
MGTIKKIEHSCQNPYINLYTLFVENKVGRPGTYYVASRAKSVAEMKLKTRKVNADGVIIYSLYGEKRDKVVLIRQYRYSIDDYIYEFPAGLVEPGEDFHEAAVREMKEETGLDFTPRQAGNMYEKPYFTTIGLTDEACATVYGYADGTVSADGQEESEEIEVVLADRAQVRQILKEGKVAIMCAYMLMHFLHEEKPFGFLE